MRMVNDEILRVDDLCSMYKKLEETPHFQTVNVLILRYVAYTLMTIGIQPCPKNLSRYIRYPKGLYIMYSSWCGKEQVTSPGQHEDFDRFIHDGLHKVTMLNANKEHYSKVIVSLICFLDEVAQNKAPLPRKERALSLSQS